MVALPRREVIEKNIVHLCSPEMVALLLLETGLTDNVDKPLGSCPEPKWTFFQVQITQKAFLHLPFKLLLPYVPFSLRKTCPDWDTLATICKLFSPDVDHHLFPLDNFPAAMSFHLCVGKGQGWEVTPVSLIEGNQSASLPLWKLFFLQKAKHCNGVKSTFQNLCTTYLLEFIKVNLLKVELGCYWPLVEKRVP